MKKAGSIIGATGYAGAELTAILARHPSVEVCGVYSGSSSESRPVGSVHPSLRKQGLQVQPFSLDAVVESSPDVVFLATPNEVSAEVVPQLHAKGITAIDLSGSFRLPRPVSYRIHYGFEHPAPELLGTAVYGLTEWCNGELEGAKLVANPGCYPTAILLALRPLRSLLDKITPIICDAKSGVSGAGKRAELDYSFTELSGDFKAYSVGGHRHQPEIVNHLGAEGADVVFVPHLLPVPRGILATIYLGFSNKMTETDLAEVYEQAYENAPFVHVLEPGVMPALHDVVSTPDCMIGFRVLEGGRHAVVVSVIDNLLKGAASQAVQNFNRVFGLPETEGLQ